jgi:bile acid:Na+ symporter, BASS family
MGAALLKTAVDAGVPVLVFVAMVVVGMELTPDDFRRVARQPGIIATATVGQFVLLPGVAWLLVRSLNLQPALAHGLLLVAACPGGALANVYVYLARGNVALSVTLTAGSCLAAVLTMPLALGVLQALGGESIVFSVPLAMLAGQLFFMVLLPILTGMGIRRRLPDITRRHGRSLLVVNIAALGVLLGFVIVMEAEHFAIALTEIAVAASLLTALAFVVGWAVVWASGAQVTDCFTVAIVFITRNVGIATAVAVSVLGKTEFAVFATAYFLIQVPLIVAMILLGRGYATSEARREITAVGHE